MYPCSWRKLSFSLFLHGSCNSTGKRAFAVFNAAKQFLQTHEQVSLYEELVRKGHSSHSLDEVINSASIKLGYSLVFCDKKFRILSYSTSIPVTDKLWKKNIERGYCTYDFIKNVMSLEAVQGLQPALRLLKYLARNHHIVNVVRKCF